jgi:ABC-type phosphate/phosphonate transport system permease subunit
MKRVTIWALVGAVAFSLLSTWLGPKIIGWYVTPADQPAAMSCQAAVIGAMRRLVEIQMIGTLIGVVLGLAIGIAFRPKKAPPATPPPAAKPA